MALKLGDMAKIPTKQKVLLAIILSVLFAGGYYYLYYQDAAEKIQTLDRQHTTLQAKIKEQREIARNLEVFREQVQQLETQLSLLLEQLPNSAEIPSLLKSITDMGKESGLDFLKFAPQKEIIKGFYAEIPVSIAVTGEYLSFVQFADKLSQYPRIINLSNISFSTPKVAARGETVRSNVTFTATTFRFVEEQAQAIPADQAKKAAGKGGSN